MLEHRLHRWPAITPCVLNPATNGSEPGSRDYLGDAYDVLISENGSAPPFARRARHKHIRDVGVSLTITGMVAASITN